MGSVATSDQRSVLQLVLIVSNHLNHAHDIPGSDQFRAHRPCALDTPRQIKGARRIHRAPEVQTEDVLNSWIDHPPRYRRKRRETLAPSRPLAPANELPDQHQEHANREGSRLNVDTPRHIYSDAECAGTQKSCAAKDQGIRKPKSPATRLRNQIGHRADDHCGRDPSHYESWCPRNVARGHASA